MTERELWRTVGKVLRQERELRQWTRSGMARVPGRAIHATTLEAHEAGQIRAIGELARHTRLFGWSVPAVIRAVLQSEPPEPALETATDEGQEAIATAARALLEGSAV